MTNQIKLAVADDAPFIREAVRHIFANDEQVKVVAEASDGNAAIKMATEAKPNIILMDIVMPDKSGIEATREILENNPSIKIIACSTLDQENMVMQALDAGCCSYIVKPFTAEQLIDTIKNSIQRS